MSGIVDQTHRMSVRVYYEDTDAGAIVYHASYVRFMERGRTEFLRERGISQRALASAAPADVILFAVRHMEIDFLKPAKLDDLLDVTTRPVEIGGARVELLQEIRRDGEVLARARVTVVGIGANGRARRIPDHLRPIFAVATGDA